MSEKESTAATPGQPVASETASEREAIASSTVSLLGSVEQIAARRQAVLKRWSEFKEVAAQRRAKLQDSKKLQQFNRNCEELEAWIASRLKIASEEAHKDPTNLQAKIKKHKTFEAEIHANENALSTVKLSGHELINHGHYAADAIAAKIEFVEEQWALLLERSKLKARKLQEAQALLAFKREVDEVDAWIQSKAEIASSKDVGKDLEHVGMLQKKFDDFTNDLTASDVRVDAVNKMAVDLIRQGHPEQTFIQQRQQAINDAWAALKKQAAQRHELLSNAKQIHAFNRDADEIDSRISEKMAMLSTEDYGKDLASVEALQRKHEVFTRDLAALGDSVASLSDDARRLCTAFPDSAGDVRTKRDAVSQHWEQLSSAARQRKTKLDDAHDLQRFLNDLQSSTSWIADMTSLMSVEETVRDVAGADALLQRHQERHDELQARQANFNAVEEFGSRLILRGHYAAEEVKQRLDALKGERAALDELWKRRQHEFEEARAMQVFLRDTEQVESWLASRESALRTEDLGDSLDTVDALLKKHDDFEKSLAAHEEKTAALQQAAARLATEGHSQAAEIQARCDAVLERRAALVKAAAERRTKLEASKQLQEFKRDADEAEAWMKEKLQAATDGAYKDPTNLRGKIKNHEAFKAELQANESRVTAVQDAGAQLVQQGHYATDYIEQRQRELGNQWATLQEESDTKGQRLEEAHQHQEFSRRVDDMDGWCKDVEKALASEDLGRDLSSVKNLIKKHQLLEADVAGHQERLEAIQRQAKEMMDAGNFQAEAIQAREQALTTRYNAFTQPMQRRKQQLEESLQLQMFLRTLDDELSWIKEKEPLAASTNTGSSLTSVQSLQKKHNALLAELTGRKSHIQDVEKTAQQLVAGGHYAAEQVRQHRDELLQRWRALNSTAQQRTVALDHALQVQQYLADANEAQAWMAEKEPVVTNDNFGKDEDSAQGLLKKHEVVEQDLRAYKGDIERLAEDCRKCQHQQQPATPKAKSKKRVKAKHTFDAKADPKKLSVQKGEIIALVSKDSADWWRCEKDGRVGFVPAAFLREVVAEVGPEQAQQQQQQQQQQAQQSTGSRAQGQQKRADPEVIAAVTERQNALESQYTQLIEAAAARRKRLEETQQLFQFNRELDEVESWMNTREAVAAQEDVGADLEHNESIQKKFDDFVKDLTANESRLQVANKLADTLVKSGHSQAAAIEKRRTALNERWAALQALATQRRDALLAAQEVHRFNRDVDETKARFNEKDVVLSSEDYGKDVASVEALQRKHEAAMRDLQALEGKVAELRAEAERLSTAQPSKAEGVRAKLAEVDQGWQALQDKAAVRKDALAEALSYQQFLSEQRDLAAWLASMQTLASATELANDPASADGLLKRHQDVQTEIDARQEELARLREFGEKLVQQGHSKSGDIQERLDAVRSSTEALAQAMQGRRQQLEQCAELQAFKRMAEQVEAWITTREGPLESDDVGSTLDGVEAMQKKHAEFENSLAAQKEKVQEVTAEADRLVAQEHYDALAISDRKHAVSARWEHLLELSDARGKRLEQAMKVQQFYRDADEAEAWMAERQQVAADPSYRDPSNIQGKVQKHQTFHAEVTANEGRIFSVINDGKRLIGESPDHATPISERIAELERAWRELCTQSEDKTQKLRDAENLQQFNIGLEDVDFWLSEVELQLSSRDLGKDLPAVQSLLKKHELVEADISSHQARIEEVNQQAQAFVDAGHFDADNIRARREQIAARYAAVQELATQRRTQLQASLQLQKILRDIDDEQAWIKEKARAAASEDFGKDLTGVQNLQKKHEHFEEEVQAHEGKVRGVLDAAADLVSAGHYAADTIAERRTQLEQDWTSLQAQSRARGAKLQEALAFQRLRADVDEEESWINEKQAMMTSVDTIETLSGAQALSKKHDAFEVDLGDHKQRVQELLTSGRSLVDAGNYQAAEIRESMVRLEEALQELTHASAERKAALGDRLEFLRCTREAESIQAWIKDKTMSPEELNDFGKDLTAVQALLNKQDAFDSSVSLFQPRVDAFKAMAEQLKANKNTHSADIDALRTSVLSQWQQLLDTAANRRKMLVKTQTTFKDIDKLFLEFAKKASQLNSWLENAEEDLTDPVRVNSLEEIRALADHHSRFIQSLSSAESDFEELRMLNQRIASYTQAPNPYTWFTVDTLQESWDSLQAAIEERTKDLQAEMKRQEENDDFRRKFAKHANEFNAWLVSTRAKLVEGTGTLEEQLEATQHYYEQVQQKKSTLKTIEDLGARMEENLILDNKYTEHSTVGLAQQWDQLEQLGMRMQHNLEQQIQAKNATGVSEEQMKEFTDTFRYFDKDGSGFLDHQEFKSCLRSLGYSTLEVVEEGEADPEFEAILRTVDPNMDGRVSQAEFMAFMISRATENVESSNEVINAFRAAAGSKPYVTVDDLSSVLTPDQVDYCTRHMPAYVDESGREVAGALDYSHFTKNIFAS
ncbi:spectrin [Salpingoeca rosetta]|uniref:Spectrin n=1 Tax=Salpingoeca rosetta (strain ATCC 50818 / BSB-021) TaxID=946362 RepID=F2ULA6_SALR5|nr:spectrin [Salpingoeca rosetta]EGD77905.1 spectrin [Salpingoeca rosetta]|eukprot:XP_004989969.1 spectrin [Salpingoeca rosetta]